MNIHIGEAKIICLILWSNRKQAFIVGGAVRDLMMRTDSHDADVTTDARPNEVTDILKANGYTVIPVGEEFGTVAVKDPFMKKFIEVTTFRSEGRYTDKRHPDKIRFERNLIKDLERRDFTINAMALELTEDAPRFIDPFDGLGDLSNKLLRTPVEPEKSFSDDPLRMMRAARFASQLTFSVADDVSRAMKDMSGRLSIVSFERIRDEFTKILMSENPRIGITMLVDAGLADFVIPEVPKLRLEIDEHHHHKDVYEHSLTVLEQAIAQESRLGGPNLVIRLAALLHDIGKPKTRSMIDGGGVSFHHHEVVGARLARERLKVLRFDGDTIEEVSTLIALHLRFHGYGDGEWTDSAVRRYVRDAGPLLEHLHVLTRADCTTRNKRKADSLAQTYLGLEKRIADLMEQEELSKIRPDLDGGEVMRILNIKPSPSVGKALDFLLELRLENGPLGEERAKEELLQWWSSKERK